MRFSNYIYVSILIAIWTYITVVFVMCHVWNIASIDVFVFITEVLITKYKSQTQKYKLWIKWVLFNCHCTCVILWCLSQGVITVWDWHLYMSTKTTVSCFPQFLNWRVSCHFPEQGSCYGMCQQMQAIYVSSHCTWGNHNRNPLCVYIHFFFCKHAIALVSVGSQFCKFCLPFQ